MGGIGGGGIYVTVLMVAGNLSPKDAVPLSKAIVFFGSLSSLALNLGKKVASSSQKKVEVIDYKLCSLVVPSALCGTLFGVFLNRRTADWILVTVLALVLVFMSYMTIRMAVNQYLEEEGRLGSSQETSSLANGEGQGRVIDGMGAAYGSLAPVAEKAMSLSVRDGCLSLFCLAAVVTSGVFRYHATNCQKGLQSEPSTVEACHHPSMWLLGNSMESWMKDDGSSQRVVVLSMVFPITVCFCLMVYYGTICTTEGWRVIDVLKYQVMALCTGCLAGLVGIGGGLVFSPFFLLMGLDPAIAVATSSTCVIFTSSSTTLQYLLTDRIMMVLTMVYGITNLIASYLGTTFVHYLQDGFATRKSYITSIVAVGVLISAALAFIKLFDEVAAVHSVEGHSI